MWGQPRGVRNLVESVDVLLYEGNSRNAEELTKVIPQNEIIPTEDSDDSQFRKIAADSVCLG